MKKQEAIREALKSASIISFVYFIFGLTWITFSDDIARKISSNIDSFAMIQTYKGYFFILLSAGIFFLLTYIRLKQNQIEKYKLAKAQRALNAINKCNHILVRSKDTESLSNNICKTIVDIGGYNFALVALIEDNKLNNITEYASSESFDFFKDIKFINTKGSPSEFVIQNKSPFVCRDISTSSLNGEWKHKAIESGLNSTVCLPLVDKEEIIGIFTVYATQKNAFDDDDLRLLIELSDDLGFGIKSLKIEKEKSIISEQLITFRQAIEQTAESVFITDTKGYIEYVNPAFERFTGYSNQEIIGKTPKVLLAEKQVKAFYDELRDTLKKGEVFRSVLVNKKKDSKIYYAAWIISPIKNAQGVIKSFVAVQADITELYRTKEELLDTNKKLKDTVVELRSTQSQIIQQERLRALGEMASGIVHDFNNTLQPILGNTELFLAHPDYLDDKARVIQALTMINTLTLDASFMVGRLREFYRQKEDQERFHPMKISEVIKEAVLLTEPKWRDQSLAQGIPIEINVDLPQDAEINGNESEMRETFVNFIFNSVDAMPEGGTLKISGKKENNKIEIIIADTGIGMSEEVKRRCMEPFFSTKGKQGTGLGLAIVWGIIRRHDGEVKLESEPGKGAKFILEFPLLVKDLGAVVEKRSEGANKTSLKILLVDDEAQIREIISLYLSGDGHIVKCAENGFDGLEVFQSDNFDLVITDKAMPKMNGDQFASMIKASKPNTPVIMLSGFSGLAGEEQDPNSKIDVALSKPVTLNKIREAIVKAISRY